MLNLKTEYNYAEVCNWLQARGADLYGDSFKLLEEDNYVIYKLIAYFLRDPVSCERFGIDLTKGILLTGPVGCGKTSLMSICKSLCAAEFKYHLKPCRDVSFEFIKEGYETIHKYSRAANTQYRHYCFDDLGTEQNLKYFGNECNVMAEVMLSRYDLFVSRKIHTHITTNLSASEIESQYGNRLRSRLRQMVNLVAFNPATPDKRQ